jgi:NADH:ubiquinone oxidoreductase subunit F (NADH-binding)
MTSGTTAGEAGTFFPRPTSRPAQLEAASDDSRVASRLLRGLRPDGRALTLAQHVAVHGPIPAGTWTTQSVLAAAEASGLQGRGGARHPLAAKLRAVRAARSMLRHSLVVVNAGDSEPAVRKDSVLVQRSPHLVLDGLAAAALAVGAGEAVLWLHRGQPAPVAALQGALDERAAAGVPGPRTRIVQGPDRFVSGEASAVVRHLSGGPAKPTTAPPHTASRGVDRRPTLVSNAETLAHLALVVRRGPRWFRAVGTGDEPGTVLVSVAGCVADPGVVEAEVGTSLAALVQACGGTADPGVSALLVGGYAGSWVHPDLAAVTAFSVAGLAPLGAAPGAGLLAVLPAHACLATETARLVTWLASEGAGQCGPCLNGLPALAGAARTLAGSGTDAGAAAARLDRWAAMVDGRGACHHPDGVSRLVRSLLRGLPDEVSRHATGGRCADAPPHGVLPLPGWRPVGGVDPWL